MKSLLFILILTSLQARAITNGQVITPEQAPAVVLIEDLKVNSVGTGVFISDSIILTADHCIASQDLSSIRVNGKKIKRFLAPPPHSGFGPALDIALIEVESVKDRKQFEIRKTELPQTPIEVFIFGYGLAYTSEPGLVEDHSLLLRVGKNILEPADRNQTYLNLTSPIGPYKAGEKSGAMVGDSGGPMIHDHQLIGIASKSMFGHSNYVNLQGPSAQKFLKAARAKGWKFDQSPKASVKNGLSSSQCKKSVQGF